ncbi:MAG: hypothetical protein ACKV2T_21365 [Kofleriaceae bacterium]
MPSLSHAPNAIVHLVFTTLSCRGLSDQRVRQPTMHALRGIRKVASHGRMQELDPMMRFELADEGVEGRQLGHFRQQPEVVPTVNEGDIGYADP